MEASILNEVTRRLNGIEKEHNIRILYAVESGSRAWGFESGDSDYDIRFIYRHELEWYLNVLPKRDVVEYAITDDFDFAGWDLRKSFFLLNKSNPVLFEWLRSPIVYFKDEIFYESSKRLSAEYFSPVSTIYHYLHMARRNKVEFLGGEMVKIKKYFYVLRPILACMWVEKYSDSPPMEFSILLDDAVMGDDVKVLVKELIARKKSGMELGLERAIPGINGFIDENLDHFSDMTSGFNPREKPPAEKMEREFVRLLKS